MFSIIVAMDKNRVIGKSGSIPWILPDDLKHFSKITTGHKVIMGRKTYESIISSLGKPLPNRENIILTTQVGYQSPGCKVFHNTEDLMREISFEEEVFVIGGSEIYKMFLPIVDTLYITQVEAEVDGDTFFPSYEIKDWKEISAEYYLKNDKNSYSFTCLKYKRK